MKSVRPLAVRRGSSEPLGARLHGMFALIVLVYAAYIADRNMRWLGLRGTPPVEPAVAPRTADPV